MALLTMALLTMAFLTMALLTMALLTLQVTAEMRELAIFRKPEQKRHLQQQDRSGTPSMLT